MLYTDVDRDAPFVRHADVAVRLPAPDGEVRAYLDRDAVVAALRAAGVDAVWPGWGFLAEIPRSPIAWWTKGGDPRTLRRDDAGGRRRIAAKQAAERVGVPVAPWSGES